MLVFLSAGFGEPLPAEEHGFIRSLGFDGIRTDVPQGLNHGQVEHLVVNALEEPTAKAIFVVSIHDPVVLAHGVARALKLLGRERDAVIEVGNEVDAEVPWAGDPARFGREVAFVANEVERISSVRVISGGVRNTNPSCLAWLREACRSMPDHAGVGYHTYRNGTPLEPHHGLDYRGEEFERLREAAGPRELWHTETGWHTAPRPKKFPLCFQKERLAPEEIGKRLITEMRLNQQAGAQSFCVYQLNDGPTDTPIDRYGLRGRDGRVKASALILADALGGRHS